MVYQWITLAGTVVSLPLVVVAWRARPKPGAEPLVVVMLAIATWNATQFLATVTPNVTWSIYWARLHFVGLTLVVPAIFALVLEYAGRDDLLTRRTVALLLVEPVVVNVLLWTSEYDDLFFRYAPVDAQPTAGQAVGGLAATGVVPVDPGPLFWAHAAYAWLLAFVSLLLVGWLAVRRRDIYRGQLLLLAGGIVVPLTGSVVDNVGLSPVRLTEPGFVVSACLLTVAVTRFDFVDLTPVARATVLSELSSAILVVDRDERITDCNPAARRMFALDDDVIGTGLGAAFGHVPDVYERYASMREGEETVAVDTAVGTRHFRVQVSPLTDRRERYLGRVFLVDDVTDDYERRVQLERQNEQLDRFASVVSHDLRNPLQVADGHVQLAYDADDDTDHLDEIARSHDRMATIIDDVLTMARQGQTIEETEPTDLAAVADAAWAAVDTDGGTLENDLHGVVESDESRLQQAFENLFRNALVHGQERAATEGTPRSDGGGVTVHAGHIEADGSGVIDPADRGFFVADDGPGIPPEKRDQVFEAGYTESEDGTGLGLSIVTSIVDAHGWTLDVTESEDGGARFEITGVDVLESDDGRGAEET